MKLRRTKKCTIWGKAQGLGWAVRRRIRIRSSKYDFVILVCCSGATKVRPHCPSTFALSLPVSFLSLYFVSCISCFSCVFFNNILLSHIITTIGRVINKSNELITSCLYNANLSASCQKMIWREWLDLNREWFISNVNISAALNWI